MANETQVFTKRKKDVYPEKTTINLYYKEDRTTGASTFSLYAIFAVLVLGVLAKIFFFDVMTESKNLAKKVESYQATLDNYMESLKDYDTVNTEYNKYSASYLTEEERFQDRLEVLDMLEDTIFAGSSVESISISGDIISVSITDVDLEKTSVLAKKLEDYDMVDSVSVNTASFGGTYTTNMVITLVPEGTVSEAGGEQ